MSSDDAGTEGMVRLVEVFSTSSAPEAEVVRSLLEAADIPVVVRGMTQGPYRMGATYLCVPEDLEVDARLVIEGSQAEGEETFSDVPN